MRVADIKASEEQSQYVGQVYQEHYARLRDYFLPQLGDASEADACIEETFNLLFFFMEDRPWEAEAEYIPSHLMKIAGLLCSKRLAAKGARRAGRFRDGLLGRLGGGAVRAVREHAALGRLLPSATGGGGVRAESGRLQSFGRAPAASV
jgi:hypothetical protein